MPGAEGNKINYCIYLYSWYRGQKVAGNKQKKHDFNWD